MTTEINKTKGRLILGSWNIYGPLTVGIYRVDGISSLSVPDVTVVLNFFFFFKKKKQHFVNCHSIIFFNSDSIKLPLSFFFRQTVKLFSLRKVYSLVSTVLQQITTKVVNQTVTPQNGKLPPLMPISQLTWKNSRSKIFLIILSKSQLDSLPKVLIQSLWPLRLSTLFMRAVMLSWSIM